MDITSKIDNLLTEAPKQTYEEWWDKNKEKFKKQGLRILINSPMSPGYFTVMKPFDIWIQGKMKPTHAYYGNAQIHQAESTKSKAKKGDEYHWLPGGNFLISGGSKITRINLSAPKGPFERSGGDYSDLRIKRMLFDKKIKLVKKGSQKKVQYPTRNN